MTEYGVSPIPILDREWTIYFTNIDFIYLLIFYLQINFIKI